MRKTKFLLFVLAFMMFGVMNAEIARGTCGKDGGNITWVLDDDGTLTLNGRGEMEDYFVPARSYAPWDRYRDKIVKLSISEEITKIGHYSFYDCSSLISVSIPNSVTDIGVYAFYNCNNLQDENGICYGGNWVIWHKENLMSANIREGVVGIGNSAFDNCDGLTSVAIPNSVMIIGRDAFRGCSGLTSVVIPNSVMSIGDGAFYECKGLTSFQVDTYNPIYYTEDNVLFNKDKTELIYCAGGKAGSYTIPNSVANIKDMAFYYCSGLTSVTIPNSVTSIGQGAFCNCSGLTSMTIPNSVTIIEKGVFESCSSLITVTIPNSVTSIEAYAFQHCSSLTSVTIPASVTNIVAQTFLGCYNLKTIYYNSNAKYTFDSSPREVYYGDDITIVYPISPKLSYLNKVVLGKSVETIRAEAFKGASLTEFYISGNKDIFLYPNVFQDVSLSKATLYVPKSRLEYYKATAPWNEFGRIVNLDENEFPETNKEQCAGPTITYYNGKLIYHTDTEGAEIVSEVRIDDAKISYGFEVPLSATYNITAYATKNGYDNSEVVTATLVWIDAQFTTDSPSDVQAVTARPILISSNDGNVTIKGLEDNENVDVYSLSGAKLNSIKSAFGTTSFKEDKGNVVIVKIGDKSIRVVVK